MSDGPLAWWRAVRPWADPEVVALRRLPMRAPLGDYPAVDLDGTWRFSWHAHPLDVPDTAVAVGTSTDGPGWRDMPVPGCWPLHGTPDPPQYLNVEMPWTERPPDLPERLPTGVYRRGFELPGAFAGRTAVLHVGAAESVHAVWVNGELAGYGTDSRLASEYDVTALVRPGANEVAIVVVRATAQSFLEDQDQWWLAGLHRSVRLEARPRVRLHDVAATCGLEREGEGWRGTVALRAEVAFDRGEPLAPGHRVRARLLAPDGAPRGPVREAPVPVDLEPYVYAGTVAALAWDEPDVAPWSAESPVLHGLEVELLAPAGEVIDAARLRVGFRRVEVRERALLVNGARIPVQGVNRHDHHPDRGRAVTVEDMRADLVAMKRANVNAVRTSHYPNDPRLLDLCDELGLYVVDEANAESHAWNTSLCHDPRYRATWLARGERMAVRDRSHACVILWSLGNEAGYGESHDALAALLRRLDPSRPLHYEGAIFHAGWVDGGLGATDVVCPMYAPIDAIVAYGASGEGTRPLILCEYSHAMGNSNGSLADYWAAFDATPGLQGGFVWEWKDHGLRQRLPDGRERLAYGGQFDEGMNDGNFVADGIVGAELDPHPALAELAWVHRPLAVRLDGDALVARSRLAHVGTDGLETSWELLVDGAPVASGLLDVPPLAPGASARVPLPAGLPAGEGDVHLTLRTRLAAATAWAPAGHLVAWDQVELRRRTGHVPPPRRRGGGAPSALDLLGGTPPALDLYRATTDNDGFKVFDRELRVGGKARARWREQGVDRLPAASLVDEDAEIGPDRDGALVCRHVIDVPAELADLPRVGVAFELPEAFARVRWFGRGPHECYPDRQSSALVGIWESGPDELPYLVPQEFGLRTDCRWFELVAPSLGLALRITALDGLLLHCSATHHRAADLDAAMDRLALVRRDGLVVHVDVAHRGLGTASCGPDVLDRYRIPAGRHALAYRIDVVPAEGAT